MIKMFNNGTKKKKMKEKLIKTAMMYLKSNEIAF